MIAAPCLALTRIVAAFVPVGHAEPRRLSVNVGLLLVAIARFVTPGREYARQH